jgi:hypothetical protein
MESSPIDASFQSPSSSTASTRELSAAVAVVGIGPGEGDKDDDSIDKVVRKRTKTGCQTCRTRRIKCDEHKPDCHNCIKSKRQCGGTSDPYPKTLILSLLDLLTCLHCICAVVFLVWC